MTDYLEARSPEEDELERALRRAEDALAWTGRAREGDGQPPSAPEERAGAAGEPPAGAEWAPRQGLEEAENPGLPRPDGVPPGGRAGTAFPEAIRGQERQGEGALPLARAETETRDALAGARTLKDALESARALEDAGRPDGSPMDGQAPLGRADWTFSRPGDPSQEAAGLVDRAFRRDSRRYDGGFFLY